MKILVINGSPKGEDSITLQTVRYLEQQCPQVPFEVLHAGQKIKALEHNFSSAVEAVKQSDFLLFSYPVYTFLVPSQLHRFLELMKNSGLSLAGKHAVGALLANPKILAKMGNKRNEGMLMPYKKLLDSTKKWPLEDVLWERFFRCFCR